MHAIAPFWDNLARDYAKSPIKDLPAYERKLSLTKARLRPQDVVMDIGCGTGSLALELSPHVARVHAVDVSSEMLRIAQDKSAAAGVDNVDFHLAQVEQLPEFPDESLDGVCAYNILHLVRQRPLVLSRIIKMLRPGGFFIGSTLCLAESAVPFAWILPVLRWLGKAPAVEVFDYDTHLGELDEAGFAIIKMHQVGAKSTVAFVTAHKPR